MNTTISSSELPAFATGFETTSAPVPAEAAPEEPTTSFQTSERYTTQRNRLGASWSVFSSAFRLGMLEMRSDNDLSRIVKTLRGLNDRQLRILGFERDHLEDEVRELILIDEGHGHERTTGDTPALKSVQSALARAS